jgi:hypothetical protein
VALWKNFTKCSLDKTNSLGKGTQAKLEEKLLAKKEKLAEALQRAQQFKKARL